MELNHFLMCLFPYREHVAVYVRHSAFWQLKLTEKDPILNIKVRNPHLYVLYISIKKIYLAAAFVKGLLYISP